MSTSGADLRARLAPASRPLDLRRLLATGFAFVVFGLSALGLSLVVCPLLTLSAADAYTRHRRVQRAVHHACRWFIGVMQTLGLLSYEIFGEEHLCGRGQMIVANHPSLIDVLFLIACVPEAVCIVKHALRRNPVLTWVIGSAGYVSNGSPDGLVVDCVAALASGHSLIVFPEGTRSTPGCPLALRRGAARIALESDAPIVPVRIRCEPATLTKGTRWYQIPPRPPHLTFTIGAPLCLACEGEDSTAGRARALTQQLARLLAPDADLDDGAGWCAHTRRVER